MSAVRGGQPNLNDENNQFLSTEGITVVDGLLLT